jgi:lysophospholipase L1-like esterase
MAELSLRAFDPIGLWYFTETSKYFASMQPNETYAYIHTPGFRGRFQGVDVVINSAGFRGPEIEAANPRMRMRVVILGDSVVFGWGAPQNTIFPIRLQSMLERVIPEVEVIPIGVGSWNTRTEYEYLRSTGVHFGAEVIVLLITDNDLYPHPTGRTDVPKNLLFMSDTMDTSTGARFLLRGWNAAVRWSYLMAYAQYFRGRYGFAESQANPESSWEDARLALDGIVRLSRDAGAVLLIFLYGSTNGIEKDPALRRYRAYFKANALDYFALPEELFTNRRLRNSAVDGHPNANGHALIAREMYEHLMPVVIALKAGKRTEQRAEARAVNRLGN